MRARVGRCGAFWMPNSPHWRIIGCPRAGTFLTHLVEGIPGWDWGVAMASGVRFLTVCFAGGASSAVAPGQGSSSSGALARGSGRRALRGTLSETRSKWRGGRRPAERWYDIDRAVQRAPRRAASSLACCGLPGRLGRHWAALWVPHVEALAASSWESGIFSQPAGTTLPRSERACEQKRGEAANMGGSTSCVPKNGSERSPLRAPRAITRVTQIGEAPDCQGSAGQRALPR